MYVVMSTRGFYTEKGTLKEKKKRREEDREAEVKLVTERKGEGGKKIIMLGFLFPLFHRQTVRTCVCMRDD